jgi:hypothetical protein
MQDAPKESKEGTQKKGDPTIAFLNAMVGAKVRVCIHGENNKLVYLTGTLSAAGVYSLVLNNRTLLNKGAIVYIERDGAPSVSAAKSAEAGAKVS